LFRQILAVLEQFRPNEAAVEETFVNKNPASALKLGVARGVVLLAPAERFANPRKSCRTPGRREASPPSRQRGGNPSFSC
jgi:hypothetical protein